MCRKPMSEELWCIHCGYCLQGIRERCPECGNSFDRESYNKHIAARTIFLHRLWAIIVVVECCLCLAFPLFIGTRLYRRQIMGDVDGRDLAYWALIVGMPTGLMFVLPVWGRWCVFAGEKMRHPGLVRPPLTLRSWTALFLLIVTVFMWSLRVATE